MAHKVFILTQIHTHLLYIETAQNACAYMFHKHFSKTLNNTHTHTHTHGFKAYTC